MSLKKPYLVIAVVGIVAASLGAWWLQNKSTSEPASVAPNPGAASPAGGPQRPVSVEVAKVETTKLVDETQSVGSLRSNQGVMLRPEVGGRVSQVMFRDGQRVKKGQVLVQFDSNKPF